MVLVYTHSYTHATVAHISIVIEGTGQEGQLQILFLQRREYKKHAGFKNAK